MRCSRLTYLVCVNLLVLLLLVLAATPLMLYPTSNDNDASTTLLSTFLVTQAFTLTVALYRPTKDSRAKTHIIAFCLAQILLFAAASTGVSVALSLSLYEDSDVPSIEVAGGSIFTLGSLSLILSSIVDVDAVDEGGEDVAASKNATTMSLLSPTDGDSITEPLLQQTANPTATKTTATSSTPPKNPTTRLLSLAIPHRAYLYAGCIALLIRLPFSLSIPHFVSEALGSLSRSEIDTAYHNIILLFVAGTVDACLDFWCVYLFGLAQLNLVKTVRTSLFSRLLSFEVNFFDQNPVGNLTSRLNSDTSAMSSDLTWFFRFSIEATVRITGIVTYMFIRSPVLAGAACCVIPLVAIVNKKYGDWLSKNSKEVQTALAEANSVAQEALSCVRTVIAFGSEEQERKHYNELIEVYYRLNVKQTIAQGVYYMVISTFLVNTVVQAILLYVGSRLVEEKGMEVDVLLAFMLYQGQLQEYTLQIFQSYTALLQSSGAGDKVFELMDRKILEPGMGSEEHGREEDENTTETLITTESPTSKIDFMEVSFKYPTRPEEQVLSNLNLTIESGQTVAIVGQSGCGKSTIVSLLARFYDVDSGTIRFNDRDIRQGEELRGAKRRALRF
ncbi:hypothetical protein TL16_g01475 [Triparma laevis f. inornata]|uniref:ABC transmembrane type-1 domain-containing protein n=1 Tax=Triparma laevis f. inornata TaxID=1714386 RepID=A0A9W6ZK56_9STRA|nr:hypothetical protein TL16_g01475 [Triparma laevis f. inornata]